MNPLNELREYVKTLPTGLVSDEHSDKLLELLYYCWGILAENDTTSMYDYKLHRAEELTIESPDKISFLIERHGSTAFGSVYADMYKWWIDLTKETAECVDAGKRLVYPKDKVLKTKPLAEEIAQHILSNDKECDKLKWINDKKVRVLIGEVIPETNKQTTSYRRKRFREKLEKIIFQHNWKYCTGYNTYEQI